MSEALVTHEVVTSNAGLSAMVNDENRAVMNVPLEGRRPSRARLRTPIYGRRTINARTTARQADNHRGGRKLAGKSSFPFFPAMMLTGGLSESSDIFG